DAEPMERLLNNVFNADSAFVDAPQFAGQRSQPALDRSAVLVKDRKRLQESLFSLGQRPTCYALIEERCTKANQYRINQAVDINACRFQQQIAMANMRLRRRGKSGHAVHAAVADSPQSMEREGFPR